MPSRTVAARELSKLFGVFSHPERLRVVEELRDGERDVNALQGQLGCTHSRVSQHLSVLRAHRLVVERRDGRHVYYRLTRPDMAEWLLLGLKYLEADLADVVERRLAIEAARQVWDAK